MRKRVASRRESGGGEILLVRSYTLPTGIKKGTRGMAKASEDDKAGGGDE